MFSLENDTDVVVCPYNKAHRLLRKRLQSHLIKCRKNYPQLELQKCPFNVTHHIPEPEFAIHVTNCPDRKLITQYKYDTVEIKEEVHVRHAPVECDENWDDEEFEDYNPEKFIDKKNVLRRPVGVPPAERKQFIKSERKRLGDEEDYSDSEEYEEEELENMFLQAMQKEKASGDNDDDASTSKRKRETSPSPTPPEKSDIPKFKTRSRSPQIKRHNRLKSRSRSPQTRRYNRSRSRSRSPQIRRYNRSKSRSRSPVTSAFYIRIHGRDSHLDEPPPPPPYKEPSFIRERSPINRNRDTSPTAYNIDDDPYYNGSSGSSYRNDNYNNSIVDNTPSNYSSAYMAPPFVAYPTRLPSYSHGRGAYRGYDRRSGYRHFDTR